MPIRFAPKSARQTEIALLAIPFEYRSGSALPMQHREKLEAREKFAQILWKISLKLWANSCLRVSFALAFHAIFLLICKLLVLHAVA